MMAILFLFFFLINQKILWSLYILNCLMFTFVWIKFPQWLRICLPMQETQVWSLGQEDSPGGRNGNLLQCSCLEIPTDRGAWWATLHGVTKSWTWLSMHTHTQFFWNDEIKHNIRAWYYVVFFLISFFENQPKRKSQAPRCGPQCLFNAVWFHMTNAFLILKFHEILLPSHFSIPFCWVCLMIRE